MEETCEVGIHEIASSKGATTEQDFVLCVLVVMQNKSMVSLFVAVQARGRGKGGMGAQLTHHVGGGRDDGVRLLRARSEALLAAAGTLLQP